MDDFLAQIIATSWLEAVAVILAIAYVWLAARQNIWCWPCALISTGIYTWLFWHESLPFHTMLNFYYLSMAVYGWFQWRNKPKNSMPVRSLPVYQHILYIIGLTLSAWGLSYFASHLLDATYLYLDAFITIFSLFTTVLVAHKIKENWLYWMVINGFAAYLYFAKGLTLTGVLFICYFGFAIYGYIQWQRDSASLVNRTEPL